METQFGSANKEKFAHARVQLAEAVKVLNDDPTAGLKTVQVDLKLRLE